MNRFELEFHSKDVGRTDSRNRSIIYLPLAVKVLIDNHVKEGKNIVKYSSLGHNLHTVVINHRIVYDSTDSIQVNKLKEAIRSVRNLPSKQRVASVDKVNKVAKVKKVVTIKDFNKH